jgi:toxin-antitoxin system PIN domain toxin
LSRQRYLLDVNVLIALTEQGHIHHQTVMKWFNTPGLDWGLCAFSEAGLLRVTSNSNVGKVSVSDASEILKALEKNPGYRYWPITVGWSTLAAPFRERIYGHQQITDAYLLGLAINENGVLVTLDKAIKFLAGERHSKNLLVLE